MDDNFEFGTVNTSSVKHRRSQFATHSSQSAVDCLVRMFEVRGSRQRIAMQRRYVGTQKLRVGLFELLKTICKPMKVDLQLPEMGVLPGNLSATRCFDWIAADNLRFAEAIVEQMHSDKVGRVEHTGDDSLVYRFYEVGTDRGWLEHTHTRVGTEHTILRPRYVRMPADGVEMPPKAADMVRLIMGCDHKVAKNFSVITGMLAAKDSATTEVWKEDSRLKQIIKSRTTQIIGGIAALGAAAVAGASALASSAGPVAMAVADPAITLGNVCFFGWE